MSDLLERRSRTGAEDRTEDQRKHTRPAWKLVAGVAAALGSVVVFLDAATGSAVNGLDLFDRFFRGEGQPLSGAPEASVVIAVTRAQPTPLGGEDQRSSSNFDAVNLAAGETDGLVWSFPEASPGTTIELWRDVPWYRGFDERVIDGLRNGDWTPVLGSLEELYVANVEGADGPFDVRATAS